MPTGEPMLVLLIIAAVAMFAARLVERIFAPAGLFNAGSGRIPRRFVLQNIQKEEFPIKARRPLDFLTEKLGRLGFVKAERPMKVSDLGHKVFIVPFVHEEDRAVFLMFIESGWANPLRFPELMLHIITPLEDGRRVETSTLEALKHLRPPQPVDLRIVLEADAVEEIWSQHRRALMRYERKDRAEVHVEGWQDLVSSVYENWLEIAVRAQRLRLTRDGKSYRVRIRPE